MSFDVIAQRAEFLSLTLEKQKWVVIANLKPYINEGENFKTIYEYISHSEDISKEYCENRRKKRDNKIGMM